MSPYWLIAVALVADSLVGLAGGLLSEKWLLRHQSGLVSFAAGALLSAVFLDILPEALAATGASALTWTFWSFVAFACIAWFMGHHHGHVHHHANDHGHAEAHAEHAPPGGATLPARLLGGDALHNMSDGAAVAAAFLLSPRTGVAAALAVIAHEVPQEVGDYALLRRAGYTKPRALLALAAVQLSAAMGAVGIVLAANLLHSFLGPVLAVAAGSFLYIGATDLLPEIHEGHQPADRRQRITGFLAGTLLIVLASLVFH